MTDYNSVCTVYVSSVIAVQSRLLIESF